MNRTGVVCLMVHIADQIAELENELFDNAINEHTLRKEIEAGWGFAYEMDGKYVGYVLVRTVHGLSDIIRLGVTKGYQGKGIGEDLLGCVLEAGGEFMLFVRKNNERAINLYKKYGFEVRGMTEDSWLMRRRATSDG